MTRTPPICTFIFSLQCSAAHRFLHSFPTRRSSDLDPGAGRLGDRAHALGYVRSAGGLCGVRGLDLLRADRGGALQDRKSTRLNSSHITISYAVFCLKKKKKKRQQQFEVIVYMLGGL